jgi:hypothetical protein
LGIFFPENFVISWIFPPFFEITIIKLATSRPRHLVGRHLQQHFCKSATAYPGQSSFNAK